MARAMLEYTKTVLKKVSFDTKLFSKELKKAISNLLPEEILTDKPELQGSLIYLKA